MGGSSLGALRRRWYLVLLGLLGTAVLGWLAAAGTPPTYQAQGSVLFLPSQATVSGDGVRNPFLELANLDTPASIVAARVTGDETRKQIQEIAPQADYTVDLDPTVRGPVLLVVVTDATEAGALEVLQTLLTSVPSTLQALQEQLKVPDQAVLRSMQLTVDTAGLKITKATVRALVAAVAVGIGMTVSLAVGVDALLARRAQRRAARPRRGEPADEPVDEPADGPVDGPVDGPADGPADEPVAEEPAAPTSSTADAQADAVHLLSVR